MTRSLIYLILSLPLISFAAEKENLLHSDPDPKVPERSSGLSEESEYLLQTGSKLQGTMGSRQVKENQEDTDPIFYDSTTSPAEMEGTD